MSFVVLGTVSNGWGPLLKETSLEDQCRRAVAAGFGYVELRQRALGGAETMVDGDDRPWPLPDRLAALAAEVPQLGFNLAVEAPFMTRAVSLSDPYLARCAAAARALGGAPPVLRLVDLSPAESLLTDGPMLDLLVESISRLTADLWECGVSLALENSKQPVGAMLELLRRAAQLLPSGVPAPRFCWDSHNQISQSFASEDPVETACTIGPAGLFEFHFKQGSPGRLDPDVADGPIDWRAILSALRSRGYRGPALFELPPGEEIWERLTRSTAYIRSLLDDLGEGSEA